jgi:hypothetical protein
MMAPRFRPNTFQTVRVPRRASGRRAVRISTVPATKNPRACYEYSMRGSSCA